MSLFDAFARYYEIEYATYLSDLSFYESLARRSSLPSLELACGTGRVLVPLAERGFRMVGLDISSEMLAVAAGKLQSRPLARAHARLERGDMRDFCLPERFGLVFVALNSFMHLATIDEQLSSLVAAHRHLEPGGLLALDLTNPHLPTLVASDSELIHDFSRVDPATGHWVSKFFSRSVDQTTQTQEITFFYDEVDGDGRVMRTVIPFSMHYAFRYEMQLLLERAGFAVEGLYGSYDMEMYDGESERMIFVARRRE